MDIPLFLNSFDIFAESILHCSFVELVTVSESKRLFLLNASYLLDNPAWTPLLSNLSSDRGAGVFKVLHSRDRF